MNALKVLLTCSSAMLAALAAPAGAQETASDSRAATGLEELVVTARRKEELSQSVPVTITSYSGAALEALQVRNVSDLTRVTPGLFTGQGVTRGTLAPVYAIRGQLNRDPSIANDPSVAFYFAEVPWARQQGSNGSLVDVRGVEVLKGPQGTLFGRNSTGGAVVVTPNAPSGEFEGYVKAGAGSYGLLSAEGVVNVPIGDSLALRLVAQRTRRDGYMHALNSGQDYNDLDDGSLRVALRWTPNDVLESTTIYSAYKVDQVGDGKVVLQVSPANRLSAAFAQFRDAAEREIAFARTHGGYVFNSVFSPDLAPFSLGPPKSQAKASTWTLQNTTILSLGPRGWLGDVTIKNIAGYRRVGQVDNFETGASSFPFPAGSGRTVSRQFSEEIQLQGERGNLDYITGLFYFYESGSDSYNMSQSFPNPNFALRRNRVTNTSYSGFFNVNYDLGSFVEGLSASAGARLTYDRRYWNGKNRQTVQRGPITPATTYVCVLQPGLPANDGSLCNLPRSLSYSQPTWSLNLNYSPRNGSLIYASASTGYRSGGWSLAAASLASAIPYDPEKVTNYELGVKNDIDIAGRPTRLNLAAFYSDYRNVQRTTTFLIPGGVINTTINAASATMKGVEGMVTTRLTPDLEISASYSYLDPQYKVFNDIYRDPVNLNTYAVDVSDSKFVMVSKHSLSAYARYNVPVSSRWGRPSIMVSYYRRSSFEGSAEINTARCAVPGNPNPNAFYANCLNHAGRMPGYSVVNLRADWQEFLGRDFDVALFVNNVTNNYYYMAATNGLSTVGILSGYPAPPRMFGVELRVPFGSP